MNELQAKQFELLKAFVGVCEKHHLKYFLYGGTCIGAVRHKGFIPWDDDVDVCMPRPDFDKFIKLQKDFKDGYFIQTYKSDFNYSYLFAKVRDSNTTFIEKTFAHTNFNHGIYIDIFPLDGITKKKGRTQGRGPKPYLMWFFWYFPYLGHQWFPWKWKKLWLDIPATIVALAFSPFIIGNWSPRLLELWAKHIPYDKATVIGTYHTMHFHHETYPKEWFGDGVEGEFEGLKIKLPSMYDTYLTQVYGNYMQLPPENKRYGHHYHSGVSTTVGYKEYIKKQK
ncbi:MAG TPA: LicD family protein [Bacilli bacterium]|nr:LicD family protein [Bacilli bacterium]